MSSDIKKYYEEYKQFFQEKKSLNSNRAYGKQEKVKTIKFNKTYKKEDIHNLNIIPFGYNAINNEQKNLKLEDEITLLEKKSFNLKKKKILIPMKNITIGEKLFYKKNGRSEKFRLFNENEIGLNKYDDKVSILESEEDYDSDDMIIIDGVKKAEEDLFEGIEIFKKDHFKDIHNYQKYYKYKK